MFKIFKMDIYRLQRSTSFYVSLLFITMMSVAMVMSDDKTTLNTLMGITTNVAKEDVFMTSITGPGVINILLGITLSLFVSSDFSSGYIKNIFTVHSNYKDYYFGKFLSFSLLSIFLLLIYIFECLIFLATIGNGVNFSASVIEFVLFAFQKWTIAIAFCGIILLLVLVTRKAAWEIIIGFILATGGISMMFPMLADMFHLNFLNFIYAITLSGTSVGMSMSFSMINFIHVIIVSLIWICVPIIVSFKILPNKDIA